MRLVNNTLQIPGTSLKSIFEVMKSYESSWRSCVAAQKANTK
jgi:hypothetical protein